MFNVINVSFPLQIFIICHRPGCRVGGMKKKNVFTRGSAAQFFLYAYRDVNYKKWGGGGNLSERFLNPHFNNGRSVDCLSTFLSQFS